MVLLLVTLLPGAVPGPGSADSRTAGEETERTRGA
jgi:hypothetical protein